MVIGKVRTIGSQIKFFFRSRGTYSRTWLLSILWRSDRGIIEWRMSGRVFCMGSLCILLWNKLLFFRIGGTRNVNEILSENPAWFVFVNVTLAVLRHHSMRTVFTSTSWGVWNVLLSLYGREGAIKFPVTWNRWFHWDFYDRSKTILEGTALEQNRSCRLGDSTAMDRVSSVPVRTSRVAAQSVQLICINLASELQGGSFDIHLASSS